MSSVAADSPGHGTQCAWRGKSTSRRVFAAMPTNIVQWVLGSMMGLELKSKLTGIVWLFPVFVLTDLPCHRSDRGLQARVIASGMSGAGLALCCCRTLPDSPTVPLRPYLEVFPGTGSRFQTALWALIHSIDRRTVAAAPRAPGRPRPGTRRSATVRRLVIMSIANAFDRLGQRFNHLGTGWDYCKMHQIVFHHGL